MAIEAKVYNQKGEEAGKVTLPEKVFGAPWKSDLVHQVVEGMRGNKRAATAYVKGRGEVRGGGKKPWRQKGTGRARHGSTRSPIWVGGGVTHGPTLEKTYKRKISKSMRVQALFSVLSKKFKDGEIVFVDSLEPKAIKTKDAVKTIAGLSKGAGLKGLTGKNPKALVALSGRNSTTEKSFRNIPGIEISFLKDINPMTILNRKYLVIEDVDKSVKFLEGKK